MRTDQRWLIHFFSYSQQARHKIVPYVVLFFVSLCLTFYFFHAQFLNGFTVLFSDRYDGMIELSILEHWYNVFRGYEPWSQTAYFFPYTQTLAYNDGYFLYGVIYTFFRGMGFDPFLSSELVNITVKNIGFFAAYVAMQRILKTGFLWSLLSASLFTISNASLAQSVHAQLFGVAFAPVQAVLIYETIMAFQDKFKLSVLVWGCASGLFFAAWLMTGYYMAWFFAYFTLIFALVFFWQTRREWHVFWELLKANAPSLAAVFVVIVIALVPFLTLYLPKSAEVNLHPARWTPAILDMINVGDGNLLFGSLHRVLNAWLQPEGDAGNGPELITGITPVLLLFYGVSAWYLMRDKTLKGHKLLQSFIIATMVSWFLTVHIVGSHQKLRHLWKFVSMGIPGASGIRTIVRYQIFLAAPMIATTGMWFAWSTKAWPKAVIGGVCLLLLCAEINVGSYVNLNRVEEESRLEAIPVAPASCKVFYVVMPREGELVVPADQKLYSANVDAMLISEITHIPTINGFSTYTPADWAFSDPLSSDYHQQIISYIEAHNLKGVCAFDMQKLHWLFMDPST